MSSCPPRFSDLLRAEFMRRCEHNRRYSLRAYARFLHVDPATLSQLLRGIRACTPRTIEGLGARLRINRAQLDACLTAPVPDRRFRRLEDLVRDTVAVAEEWVHHALLELTRRKDFVPDSRRLAATLGISVDEVNVALQRLLRLGFLEMRGTRWIVPGTAARDGVAFTRSALVRCHELLGHLIDATEQPSSRLSVI